MYAIVKTGGKQYRVEKGQTLLVEKLPEEEGAKVALEPLLFRSDDDVFDGDDLEKVRVEATILEQSAGRRSGCSSSSPSAATSARTGHRQSLTRIEVTDIKMLSRKPAASATKAEADAEAETASAAASASEKPAAPKKPAATRKPRAPRKPAAEKEAEDGS